MESAETKAAPSERWTFGVVLVAALLCFSAHTWRPGFAPHDELFYLEGALTANETGEYLIPLHAGQPRLKKPPLFYWLICASYRAFGVGVWQGRLPTVLAGVATIALTYWLGRMLFGERRSALYAACALLSSYIFVYQAHLALTDVVLGMFVTLAFCGFVAGLRPGCGWGAPLAWAAMGCAVMTKGPVGLLIPLGAILIWILIETGPQGPALIRVFSPIGILLFALIALPWPLIALDRLGKEAFLNPVEDELGFHLSFAPTRLFGSFIYYAFAMIRGMFPWSVLFLFYLHRETRESQGRLLWIWSIGTATTFAVFVLKHRARYLVPFLPALALLAGRALAQLQEGRGPWALLRRAFNWATILWFIGAAAVGILLFAQAVILVRTGAAAFVAAATVALSLGAIFLLLRLRWQAPYAWVTAALAMAIVQTVALFSWPAALTPNAAYTLARRHLRGLDSADIAAIGLHPHDASWARIGAGCTFENRKSWNGTRLPGYLLVESSMLAQMPDQMRGEYSEVDRVSECTARFRLLNFARGLRLAREERQAAMKTLVLLARKEVGGRLRLHHGGPLL